MELIVKPITGRNINQEIEFLNDMGFDRLMINKIYLLLKPKNIDKALDFMIEKNGFYQHNFMPNTFPEYLCYFCQKPRQYHLGSVPNDLVINTDTTNSNFNISINNEENEIKLDLNSNPNFEQISVINSESNESKENNESNEKNESNENNESNELCGVCYEKINDEDKTNNSLPCGHLFCSNCWFDYFKTLISEAKTNKIKCMESKCSEYMSEEFIIQHISKDLNLSEKYIKFKNRYEIIKDKNKKLCPHVGCDSFLQKSDKTKYVECENGHKYCFECLSPPHKNKKCKNKNEKKFLKWTKGKRVKRCPNCQMYVERNEGCNHMTCAYCDYQWCWICEQQYDPEHFINGPCAGHANTKADSLQEIEELENVFGIHQIFSCIYEPIYGPIDMDDGLKKKYICMIIFYFLGVLVNYFYVIAVFSIKNEEFFKNKVERSKKRIISFAVSFFGIGLNLLIIFQITFMCIITPFMIISFIYHPFFDRFLMFFGIGNNKYLN